MSEMDFLELAVSLSVQVPIVIAACAWLVRQSERTDLGHRLWGICHLMILVQVAVAVLLPHLRLFPHSLVAEHVPLSVVATSEMWLGRIFVIVWGIGASLYAAGIAIGVVNVRRLIAQAKPLETSLERERAPVTVLISPRVSAPFCWQFHHPRIVLPGGADTFPHEELQAIIRHEQAHLQSAHPIFLFLQRLVEMGFWFHPLVWWASRQADLHREFHCDREASRCRSETAIYLRSLLRLSEATAEASRRLPVGLNFQGSRSHVRLRVERLLQDRGSTPSDRKSLVIRIGMVVVVTAVSTGLWLPINVCASSRSVWSPWPEWSAKVLYEFGVPARDYEIDGHRLRLQELEEFSRHETTHAQL